MNKENLLLGCKVLGYFVVYFVVILLSEIPGFLSPLYWVLSPIVTAFVATCPLMMVMTKKENFGSTLILPALWFVVMIAMGELAQPIVKLAMLSVMVFAAVVREILGYNKIWSVRITVAILSLVPFCINLLLYSDTTLFHSLAIGEMGQEYADTIAQYGTNGMFILVAACTIVSSIVSIVLTEKLFLSKSEN